MKFPNYINAVLEYRYNIYYHEYCNAYLRNAGDEHYIVVRGPELAHIVTETLLNKFGDVHITKPETQLGVKKVYVKINRNGNDYIAGGDTTILALQQISADLEGK